MTWLDEVVAAMEALGGRATLRELYDQIQASTSRELSRTWENTVRQTLEDNSKDGAFRRENDVFFSVEGKGKGVWGLRVLEPVVETPLDPNELPNDSRYPEGAKQKIIVNRYERSPKARQDCIAEHGYDCAVCGFNFMRCYGSLGSSYIHVHHLVPVSQLQDGYEVSGSEDLRPICPNCHAMLHRKNPPLSIEDLRTRLRSRGG